MAKFNFTVSDSGGFLAAEKQQGDTFSVDELLEVLRPAGLKLKEYYQEAIRTYFTQRTGSLADSIDIEDDYTSGYAFITVKPFGTHKGGTYARRSRAGSPSAKGAKHNRKPAKKGIKNEELAYLLEYGTPRINATHWMENTNDKVMDEIQQIVEDGFTQLLKKKGLI